jgi:hypothetical protein
VNGVPKWPDFSLHVEDWGDRTFWIARTDTGRPVTPVFSLAIGISGVWTEEEAREQARLELDLRYAEAHPHGCP